MARSIGIFFLLMFVYVVSGCKYDQKEFDFNATELALINPYHIGDTLYFEDKSRNRDTIIIKDIGRDQRKEWGRSKESAAYNRVWVTAAHLQSDYWRGTTKSTNGNKEVTYQNIIMMEKFPQTRETRVAIEFRNFHYSENFKKTGVPDTSVIVANQKKLSNGYMLFNQRLGSMTDSTNISLIYMVPEAGLTAYKNENGNWWVRKTATGTTHSSN